MLRHELELAASRLGTATLIQALTGDGVPARHVRSVLMPHHDVPAPAYLPGSAAAAANSALAKDSKWLRFQYARPRGLGPAALPLGEQQQAQDRPDAYSPHNSYAAMYRCTGLDSCCCHACKQRSRQRHQITDESATTGYHLLAASRSQYAQALALGDADLLLQVSRASSTHRGGARTSRGARKQGRGRSLAA
jgi:hypothetical protein